MSRLPTSHLPSWADPLTQDYGMRLGWWPGWVWRPRRLAWTVSVQCRDSVASANTLPPHTRRWPTPQGSWAWGPRWAWGWPTCAVVPGLRNGVPWRCRCPPGRCEAKRGTQSRFVAW